MDMIVEAMIHNNVDTDSGAIVYTHIGRGRSCDATSKREGVVAFLVTPHDDTPPSTARAVEQREELWKGGKGWWTYGRGLKRE